MRMSGYPAVRFMAKCRVTSCNHRKNILLPKSWQTICEILLPSLAGSLSGLPLCCPASILDCSREASGELTQVLADIQVPNKWGMRAFHHFRRQIERQKKEVRNDSINISIDVHKNRCVATL